MSEHSDIEAEAVAHEFLRQYIEDREAGTPRLLEQYLELFPGYEERIASEHRALESGRAEEVEHGAEAGRIGRFRILSELGRGGQGVVYLAEDPALHRTVALKVLAASTVHSPDSLRRFQREAEAASRLDHPGICTVHEAGELGGAPYIAMRYVEGESLAHKIAAAREDPSRRRNGAVAISRSRSVALDEDSDASTDRGRSSRFDERFPAVHLIERVARALQAAHEARIVHRDIKPGNVLITSEGEPVVVDFGLARVEEEGAATLTRSGDVFGTPAYMSPEQLRSDRAGIDERTDVYSLGATLYECLTLCRPFESPTREGLYRAILNDDPPRARALNPGLPAELEVILATALEKDVGRRYQSMLDLAEDLRRVRNLEPIRARAPGPGLRLRRWAQRNPVLATATLALLVLLTAGLAITLGFNTKLRTSLRRARASALADESSEVQERDGRLALLLAREALRVDDTPRTVSQLHEALSNSHEDVQLAGHEKYVDRVVFSRDGELVLTASGDGTARVWDITGEEIAVLEHPGEENNIRDALFSPAGDRILTASHDWTARLWRLDGSPPRELEHDGAVWSADFSYDGELILTTAIDGMVRLWNAEGHLIQTLEGHESSVFSGTFSPDGSWIVSASADHTAKLWKRVGVSEWELETTLTGHDGFVYGATFSPNGERILTYSSHGGYASMQSGDDFTARLWSLSGTELAVMEHDDEILSAVFSPEGDQVLTASLDGSVVLWSIEEQGATIDLKRKSIVVDRAKDFYSARFSRAGDRVVVTGDDGLALLRDSSGMQLATLRGHTGTVLASAFSPDETLIATAGTDRVPRIWQVSRPELPLLLGHRMMVSWVAVSRYGTIATASIDGTVRLWNDRGELLEIMSPDGAPRFMHVAFSADGERVVAAARQGRIVVWDRGGTTVADFPVSGQAHSAVFTPAGDQVLVQGPRVARIYGLDGQEGQVFESKDDRTPVLSAVFSSSGDQVLIATWDGLAQLRTLSGELIEELHHESAVQFATISRDGELILTTTEDQSAYLWDLGGDRGPDGRLRPRQPFHGHEGVVQHAAFSPDGKLVSTTSGDKTARLWTLDGHLVAVLRGHLGAVEPAAFSPSGDRLYTASKDGTVRCWPVGTASELVPLVDERLSTMDFTRGERTQYAELLGKLARKRE